MRRKDLLRHAPAWSRPFDDEEEADDRRSKYDEVEHAERDEHRHGDDEQELRVPRQRHLQQINQVSTQEQSDIEESLPPDAGNLLACREAIQPGRPRAAGARMSAYCDTPPTACARCVMWARDARW